MAAISFPCPECGKKLSVKEELAGKKGKCPHCGNPVLVPAAAGAGKKADADGPTLAPRAPAGKAGESKTLSGKKETAQNTVTFLESGDVHGDTMGSSASEAVSRECYDFLAPPQAPDEIGRLGTYRVLKVLGAGGMGVVFQAEDPSLKRLVALKAMLPTLAVSESNRKRFLREAQTAASLEHDNIVPIYQVSEDRGVPFIAMPFLKGEALDKRLEREKVPPLVDVLRIARETAQGLAAAHASGLIHRDIKPANIWLERRAGSRVESGESRVESQSKAHSSAQDSGLSALDSFRVRILDFGLARDTSGEGTQLTQTGAILGTPAYMAPEQAQSKKADARCDLFSLGVVLYRMVTGALPFKGSDAISTLMAVTMEEPPAPREISERVPKKLSDFIMKLLEKSPDERVGSAADVVTMLAALEKELGPEAVKPASKAAESKTATSFRYSCPDCQAHIKTTQPVAAGKKTRCPKCKAQVVMRLEKAGEGKTLGPGVEEHECYGLQEIVDVVQPEVARPKKKKQAPEDKSRKKWVLAGVGGGGTLLALIVIIAFAVKPRDNSNQGGPDGGQGGNTGTGPGPGTGRTPPGTTGQTDNGKTDDGKTKPPPPAVVTGNWQPLFENDLGDYEGLPQYWRVANASLVGSSIPNGTKFNTCLVSKKKFKDFELKFQVKLSDLKANSGVQFRSYYTAKANFVLKGPQADMGQTWWGSLYEEGGGLMKGADKQQVARLVKPNDFNDYAIKVVGQRVTIQLNGETTIDEDFPAMPADGHIGWQIHSGPPMEATFRNVQFRELGAVTPSTPIGPGWQVLFDGASLANWKTVAGGAPQFKLENGHAEVNGPSIITKDLFGPDYDLHVEFLIPVGASANGNSGVFLNGRHEIQVYDSYAKKKLGANDCGALYNIAAPTVNACKPAGEWQAFDISFNAPSLDGGGALAKPGTVTIVHNGVKVLDNVSITGTSAQALTSKLSERGPIMLQQNGGAPRFRNIQIRPKSAQVAAPPSGQTLRVVMIDGQNNHNWRSTSPLMKKALEDTGRFTVDVATNYPPKDPTPSVNFPPDLRKYDVVVSNYNGAAWPAAFNTELETSLKAGKIGFVIVHAANNAFGGWKEYNDMIGLGWRSKAAGPRLKIDDTGKEIRVPAGADEDTGHRYSGQFPVTVRDPAHPIMQGMPLEWLHANDELYDNMRGPMTGMKVLATGVGPGGKGTGFHEPVLMTIQYGQGRVFHNALGHDVNAMNCVGFVACLARGTEWAATGAVTVPLPANFPTAKQVSLVK